jgi:hypothetical protein
MCDRFDGFAKKFVERIYCLLRFACMAASLKRARAI